MIDQLTSLSLQTGLSLNTLGLLSALVAMETVLSADNAVALAALVQPLETEAYQNKALNWGLVGALVLRITLLLGATWVVQFWQVELAGALYLLWLAAKYFRHRLWGEGTDEVEALVKPTSSIWQVVAWIALTDLAFSLDSVTTAVALSDERWLVIAGCLIGVVTLRFVAGLFVQWLERFTYLQDAAYLTVLGVGLRLLCKAVQPECVPPDWVVLGAIALLFSWGFSKRTIPAAVTD